MLEICYARSYFIALAGHLAETCRKSKINLIIKPKPLVRCETK